MLSTIALPSASAVVTIREQAPKAVLGHLIRTIVEVAGKRVTVLTMLATQWDEADCGFKTLWWTDCIDEPVNVTRLPVGAEEYEVAAQHRHVVGSVIVELLMAGQ